VVLNISEGNGRSGKDRQRFFRMARGSAREVIGALRLCEVWGYFDRSVTQAPMDKIYEVCRILGALVR
jgi:four helix bundle protein